MGTRSPHEASAEVSHPFRTVPLGSDAHGCCFRRTRLISHCNFYQRACRGPLRLRLRIGCGVDLALRAHALADRRRSIVAFGLICARLFGLEAAARARIWRNVWPFLLGAAVRRPNGAWRLLAWYASPGQDTHEHWTRARRSMPPTRCYRPPLKRPSPREAKSPISGVGFLNGVLARHDRALPVVLVIDLVRAARLAEGSAARRVSAGRRRHFRDDGALDRL